METSFTPAVLYFWLIRRAEADWAKECGTYSVSETDKTITTILRAVRSRIVTGPSEKHLSTSLAINRVNPYEQQTGALGDARVRLPRRRTAIAHAPGASSSKPLRSNNSWSSGIVFETRAARSSVPLALDSPCSLWIVQLRSALVVATAGLRRCGRYSRRCKTRNLLWWRCHWLPLRRNCCLTKQRARCSVR